MEQELPRLGAFTLAQEPRCAERARRLLDGARGSAKMAGARWRLGQRIREDAALAHAERRAPRPSDFPTPTDFTAEERAVYAAAAVGYVTLFGDEPALAIDVAGHVELSDLGIEVSGRPGIFVETDSGVELRVLRFRGTEPQVDERTYHAAASLAPLDRFPIRLVAADLLSLQTTGVEITSDAVPLALEWFEQRVGRWRDAAAAGGFDQKDCYYCTFIWDCRVHERARQS